MVTKTAENTREEVYSSPAISRFQTYDKPSLVDDRGAHGIVYRISDESVVKISHISHISRYIGREMKLAKKLYESGISVPEPRGWETIRVPNLDSDTYVLKKGFVMEFVEGETRKSVFQKSLRNFERYYLAERLVEEEIEKAKELGFVPGCDWENSGNCILTPNNEIKLIDFSEWSHPEVPPVKSAWKNDGIVFENLVNPEEVFA